jgi:hypothetical protein
MLAIRATKWFRQRATWRRVAVSLSVVMGIGVAHAMAVGGQVNDGAGTAALLRNAVREDLSFGSGLDRTRPKAVQAWEQVLASRDATAEQRLFAEWRIASMYAYNFDRRRGESPDMKEAEVRFKKVLEMMPDVVSAEVVNSATQYASFMGSAMERAERKAVAYRFLHHLSDEDLDRGAERVSSAGYLLTDTVLHPNAPAAKQSTTQERRMKLRRILDAGVERIVTQIEEQIRWSRDGHDVMALMKALNDIAEPSHMARWQAVERKYKDKWEADDLEPVVNLPQIDDMAAVGSDVSQSPKDAPAKPPGQVSTLGRHEAPVAGNLRGYGWGVVGIGVAILVTVFVWRLRHKA